MADILTERSQGYRRRHIEWSILRDGGSGQRAVSLSLVRMATLAWMDIGGGGVDCDCYTSPVHLLTKTSTGMPYKELGRSGRGWVMEFDQLSGWESHLSGLCVRAAL